MSNLKLANLNNRRKFDPDSVEDQNELLYFLENNKWRTLCPFEIEQPWREIPAMCMYKYSLYMLHSRELTPGRHTSE